MGMVVLVEGHPMVMDRMVEKTVVLLDRMPVVVPVNLVILLVVLVPYMMHRLYHQQPVLLYKVDKVV
jgi:hypothetical protein